LSNLEQAYRYCEGVAPELVARWFEFLDRAANLGNVNAQLEFGEVEPPKYAGIDLGHVTAGQEQLADEWRTAALRHLSSARDQGAVEAFEGLGLIYSMGRMMPPDHGLAYAHLRVAQLINSAAGTPNGSELLLKQERERLRPDDLDAAEALAMRMWNNSTCCLVIDRSQQYLRY
jgi:TPR repeat protein